MTVLFLIAVAACWVLGIADRGESTTEHIRVGG